MLDRKIELYASGPADNTAEVDFLRELVDRLVATGCEALVVCQPRLPRCTPDFLVITELGGWTVDVKTLTGSLHGSRRDAKWRRKVAGARPKPYPNLLTNMKRHREALLDDMREGAKVINAPVHEIKSHIGAVAAVWPKIPEGSDCDRQSDHVSGYFVSDGYDAIKMIASGTLKPGWSLDLWRRFVEEHLRAIRVRTVEELCDPELFEAVQCSEAYRQEFLHSFGSQRDAFVPHPAFFDELKVMASADGALLVHGESGLGKTSHLVACAIALAREGALPVFAQAEVYDGSLARLQEVSLAGYIPTTANLLSYLPRLATQRRVLFVDGVDSVPEEQRRALISQVAEQWEQGMWSLVVLGAKIETPDVDGRLPLRKLVAPAMEGVHREAVFHAHHRQYMRTPGQKRLLEIASDGFAVRALALAGDAVREDSSLTDAIESYVRSLLPQNHALVAAELARIVACTMENRFTQSVAVEEFDRIATTVCKKERVGLSLGDEIRRSLLFRQQGDRIRFQHERLQIFLAAQVLDEEVTDPSLLLLRLKQPRNRIYARIIASFPRHRSLAFFLEIWSMLGDESVIEALIAGEFGSELRAAGISAVRQFLVRYCSHLASNPHVIVFAERGASEKPQPILAEENAFVPSQPEDKFSLCMLRFADVITELSEHIVDALLKEEESLLRAAEPHAQSRRASLQIVRKQIVSDGIQPNESILLLRYFHREWLHRFNQPLMVAIASLPARGGTMTQIISLQAKLTAPLNTEQVADALTRWSSLVGLSGFKPGRVFERYADRMLFQNWDSLIDAHGKNGEFRTLLENLVNEGLSSELIWDDTLLRFAIEIGVIEAESLDSQTARFVAALRATSNEPAMTAAKRCLFDRAVECNEWDAWIAAWSQLSDEEKRAFARDAIPSEGIESSGMLESMLVGFLTKESCIEPADLIGVFRTHPWGGVMFGIGDVAACQLELATHWGGAGKPLPADAFRDAAYSEGDAAAWPLFISLIHAVARSATTDAKALVDRLVANHPFVFPELLAVMMERRLDDKALRKVAADLLKNFRMELARACANASDNLDRVRSLIHPAQFDKVRIVSLIFQLCVDGDTETCSAVERHVDNPAFGEIAVMAIRGQKKLTATSVRCLGIGAEAQ